MTNFWDSFEEVDDTKQQPKKQQVVDDDFWDSFEEVKDTKQQPKNQQVVDDDIWASFEEVDDTKQQPKKVEETTDKFGLTPEQQAQDERIYQIQKQGEEERKQIDKEYAMSNLKSAGSALGGGLMMGASFHPIFNMPFIGTGVGGAMFDAGDAIAKGEPWKDVAKRAGRGFVVGETIGAIPYVGKFINKTPAGKAAMAKVDKVIKPVLESKFAQGVGRALTKPMFEKKATAEIVDAVEIPAEQSANKLKEMLGQIKENPNIINNEEFYKGIEGLNEADQAIFLEKVTNAENKLNKEAIKVDRATNQQAKDEAIAELEAQRAEELEHVSYNNPASAINKKYDKKVRDTKIEFNKKDKELLADKKQIDVDNNVENLTILKDNIKSNMFENPKHTVYHYKGKKGVGTAYAESDADFNFVEGQKQFNEIIQDIANHPEKVSDGAYFEEMGNRVQKIIDDSPYKDDPVFVDEYWQRFSKSFEDAEAYNKFKNGGVDKVVDKNIKDRSLSQSVVDATGTPEEVREQIAANMPQYQVLHNNDLTEQAIKEVEGNFENEISRLSTTKNFEALDYEKARQIAKKLFDMGENERAINLIDNVSENATKKGQAIQALSMWSNMTPEGAVFKAEKLIKAYNKKVPARKQIKLTEEQIKDIRNLQSAAMNTTDDAEKATALARSAKYIADLFPTNVSQKIKAFRNLSLLLNPKTLGRNIVGNALFNTFDNTAKALAVPIDRTMGLFTGKKTRVMPSVGAYLKGMGSGAKTGFKESLEGIDTRGLGKRFDLQSGRVFGNGNTNRSGLVDILKAEKGQKGLATQKYFTDLLTQNRLSQALRERSFKPLTKIPTDLLSGAESMLDVGLRTPDRAFYEATFAESVNNQMRAAGLNAPTQEMLEQAEREALEAVFQNDSIISNMTIGLRQGLNRAGTKDFGAGDVIIPYAQTPANLVQQGINYSPMGSLKGLGNLVKGDQRQASLDIARSLLGTGLIGGGYGLAQRGLITPSQYDDNYTTNKTIRDNYQPMGIRPDQLAGAWYSPFQPMSIPLATGAATYYGENPMQAGLNTILDLPFLQNLSRGLADVKDKGVAEALTNLAGSVPSQFVPTSLGQVAQVVDPYNRETYDKNPIKRGLNQAMTKIPYVSKQLPEKIDVTGQPIERYKTEGARKLFDIFLNPTFINKETNDPVLSELKLLHDITGETGQFLPSVKKKLTFTDNDGVEQKIELTGREFSEYQRLLGQRMYDEFDYIMGLEEYQNGDDYDKIKMLKKAKTLVKAEVDDYMWNKKNKNKKTSYTKGQ